MTTKIKHGPTKHTEIIDALIKGGERAVSDFFEVSDGEWFDEAPEYLLTSYVAMSIKGVDKAHALIEVSVDLTREKAGASRPGRPAYDERRNGRFDVVVYWDNGYPRGMVEVKSPIYIDDQTKVNPDFIRICKTLKAHQDSTFQFGSFLFYAYVPEPINTDIHQNSTKRMKSLLDKLENRGCNVAKEHDLQAKLERGSIHRGKSEDGGAWCISAIVFTK